MKMSLCFLVMLVSIPFLSSLAFDWSVHIDDWNGFVENYEQYKAVRRQCDSATQSVARASERLTVIDKENPFKNADNLKIGEFEEVEDFRARVEKQRQRDEGLRQDERKKIEKQRQQYMSEAQLHLKECKAYALWVSTFTNRLQSAYLKVIF